MPDYQYVPPESSRERGKREEAEKRRQLQQMATTECESLRILQAALPRLKEYGRAAMQAIEIERKIFGCKRLEVQGGWIVGNYHYDWGNTDYGRGNSEETIVLSEDGRLYGAEEIQRNGVTIMLVGSWQSHRSPIETHIRQHESRGVNKSVLNDYDTGVVSTLQHPEQLLEEMNSYLPEYAQILRPDASYG